MPGGMQGNGIPPIPGERVALGVFISPLIESTYLVSSFVVKGRFGMRKEAVISFFRAAGDVLMPRECLVCGARLGLHERLLCLACAADIPYTYWWRQPHNPLADRFNAVLERHRGTEPMDYAYAAALFLYKGGYRAIPRALKYQGNLAAGRFFGAQLGRRLASAPHFADVDLIIPVPLHWTRRRSRGYNQAAILAQAVASALRQGVTCSTDTLLAAEDPQSKLSALKAAGRPASGGLPPLRQSIVCRTDILQRARRTRTQTRLTVEQKARNVSSAFRVRRPRLDFLFLLRGDGKQGHLHAPSQEGTLGNQLNRPPEGFQPAFERQSLQGIFRRFIPAFVRQSLQGILRLFLHRTRFGRGTPVAALASARHILLIDDTFTTGATLYACYAALRPYTSARISVATLAAVEGSPSLDP